MARINEYYDNIIHRIKWEIDSKPDEYLLGVEVGELVKYYVDEFGLPMIERDNDREIEYEKEKTVTGTHFSIRRDIPLKLLYPIIPKVRLKEVIERESSRGYLAYQLGFDEHLLKVTIILPSSGMDQEHMIADAIGKLEKVILWKNNDVQVGNTRLEKEILDFITERKRQLKSDNNLLEEVIKKVPVKLQRRTKSTPAINLSIRRTIKPVYPSAKTLEEPFIEPEKVQAVLELLMNMAAVSRLPPRSILKWKKSN